jgi:hypothetical protein
VFKVGGGLISAVETVFTDEYVSLPGAGTGGGPA